MIKGIERFRQAIKNQRDLGNGDFRLAYQDAEKLCCEIEEELLEICNSAEREIVRYSWVHGVPAPKDADGEVVPLTTKVMYDECGREVQVNHFRLAGHNVGDRLKWRVREMSGIVLSLDHLHLTRPDSWERLEEDIGSIKDASCPCDYFNHPDCGMPCYSCPAHTDAEDCIAELARDVLRRARKLAERDAKGAGRG